MPDEPFRLFIASDNVKIVVATCRPMVNGEEESTTGGSITEITAVAYEQTSPSGFTSTQPSRITEVQARIDQAARRVVRGADQVLGTIPAPSPAPSTTEQLAHTTSTAVLGAYRELSRVVRAGSGPGAGPVRRIAMGSGRTRRLCRAAAVLLLGMVAALVPVTPAAADAIRDQQWYLAALGVPAAHAVTRGEGVTVAVVDSGVAADHPDLVGSVLPGIDGRTGTGNGQQDQEGHGTAMAVAIAGHGHGPGNASGVLGIAPGAKILPLNVLNFDPRNGMNGDHVARGIDFAVERGAKVINVSIGASSTPNLRNAVARALDAGVVIVASAGNLDKNGRGTFDAPTFYPGVLRICAHDRRGEHAAFSLPAQGDTQLTVCAPGVDVVATRPDGSYQTRQRGTSMSSAIVSGVVALIRSKYPDMPAHEVVNRLTATATDKGEPGLDKLYGYGNVNLGAALNNNVAPGPSPTPWVSRSPSVTPTRPATPSTATAADPPDDTTGVPVAALAGGAGVVLMLMLMLLGGGLWLLRRRSRA